MHFDGTHSLSTTELATWPDYPVPSSKPRLLPAELRLHLSLLLRPPAASAQPMVPWVVIPGEDRCIQRSLAPHSTQATLPLALRMPPPLSPLGVASTPCPPPHTLLSPSLNHRDPSSHHSPPESQAGQEHTPSHSPSGSCLTFLFPSPHKAPL